MTQQNFQAMRKAMVESQLRTSGVSDTAVIRAMASVPREWFVPADRAALAYIDRPVPLGGGRALNPPLSTGILLTQAGIRPGERVLIVGAASGYAAAVAASMGALVTALECDAALAERARAALAGQAVEIVEGPLEAGNADGAPYDVILIDGAVERLPDALVAQLAEDGRLACAILERGVARLALGRRGGAGFGLTSFADAEAVELPGFAADRGFSF